MNAESLIGNVLGTCTLQRIIGQGGMGAVFLAQQSRPRRQVAVKVLLPSTTLTQTQKAAFLERFRRETDAAASLEHPHILPVYEYGEQNGLAYLVVPYISGGTLRDVMEREGTQPLEKALSYVEQLAAALDFAHQHGVVHRDIKPANVLITPEGRLLLSDFGLVKILTEGQTPQARLTGAGAPVGTPDYMAPEQVIGDAVDGRSDQYSLGVILYQMVTGLTPFIGETPMQIAAQQLQSPPPSPRIVRKDLPIAAEQVMLRALAKRSADRYMRCQDFVQAFRAAISSPASTAQTARSTYGLPDFNNDGATASKLYTPRSLFDPQWQTGTNAAMPDNAANGELSRPTGVLPATSAAASATASASPSPRPGGLLSRTGMFPTVGTGHFPVAQAAMPNFGNAAVPQTPKNGLPTATSIYPSAGFGTPAGGLPVASNQQPATLQTGFGQMSPATGGLPTTTGAQPTVGRHGTGQLLPAMQQNTGTLATPNGQNASNTVKLTGPMKVVQMPVAGQPGRYVTGLLPSLPQTPEADVIPGGPASAKSKKAKPLHTIVIVALTLLVVLSSVGVFAYLHYGHPGKTASNSSLVPVNGTPNLQATAAAQVTATATANIILSDSLSQNIHNFPINTNEFFANGAYHILDNASNGVAVVLAEKPFNIAMVYSLTMEEIKGNDSTSSNSFGLIFRFNSVTQHGKTIVTFYSFEVSNTNGGKYEFWKYDSSKSQPWQSIWQASFGHEFKEGHGPKSVNIVSVSENGKNFVFTVNGKKVGNAQDGSFPTGTVGMLVNLKGTEVAFTNMLITHN
ncbi:MAG TPA: serine/threonine-protein kinase [Ktedonobacteraceae bacterium]|nr:serine/threonine-protein kinase [Ktedonobacteraceae bacterium]